MWNRVSFLGALVVSVLALFLMGACNKADKKAPAGEVAPNLVKVWEGDIGQEIHTTPFLAGDKLIVPSNQGEVFALDIATGKIAWKFKPTSADLRTRTGSSDGKLVFFGLLGGGLTALNINTGEPIWTVNLGINVRKPPVVDNGLLYVPTTFIVPGVVSDIAGKAKLFVLEAATGKIHNEITTDNFSLTAPAIENGIIYLSGSYHDPEYSRDEGGPQRTYAIDPAQGNKILWTYTNGHGYPKTVIAKNGYVSLIGYEDIVSTLDAKTGLLKWKKKTGNWVHSLGYDDGRIYYAPANKKIFSVDQKTGETIWFYALQFPRILSYIIGRPVVANDKVYWINRDSLEFGILDKATGQLIFKAQTPLVTASQAMPVINGTMAYLSGLDGKIFAYDMK